jgi:hypothetical protein
MASKSFHGRQPEQNDLAEGISRLKFLILDFRFTCGGSKYSVYSYIHAYIDLAREVRKAHVKVET